MPRPVRRGGGDDAMRMVYEEYYDTPKAMPLPRVPSATKRKATVTYASTVPVSAFGGYGSKTAGSSVGLPSVLAAPSVKKRSSVAKPSASTARYGGGDEAMAIANSASWESSAEQRRYRKR